MIGACPKPPPPSPQGPTHQPPSPTFSTSGPSVFFASLLQSSKSGYYLKTKGPQPLGPKQQPPGSTASATPPVPSTGGASTGGERLHLVPELSDEAAEEQTATGASHPALPLVPPLLAHKFSSDDVSHRCLFDATCFKP